MDRLRRKRQSYSAGPTPPAPPVALPRLDTELSSVSAPDSAPGSLDSTKGDFFHSVVPRALKSLARASTPRSPSLESQAPNVLRKPQSPASSHPGRRGSTSSDGLGRVSRASTAVSTSSAGSFDWKGQPVEAHAPLEPDFQLLRNKAGYLVVTADYLVVLKSKADAAAAFPLLAGADARPTFVAPEPLQVIPVDRIVAVFRAESARPSFGIEVVWRCPYPTIASSRAQLFFGLPGERAAQLLCIVDIVKAKSKGLADLSRVDSQVDDAIRRIFADEEPRHHAVTPDVFPVACRKTPTGFPNHKVADKAKRGQEGASHYIAVGINLCFVVEVAKASAVQEGPLKLSYQAFGIVTLESFRGEWSPHEERFVLKFRDPFQQPVTLELASRYYKQIAMTFMRADRYLKPAWPSIWQTLEVFRISRLPEVQHVVAGEDFGAFQRTLGAFAAGYRCAPVDWEINWRTALSPEFRVLPPKDGNTKYSATQLLAVLHALRYNDFFTALSFAGVDLGDLWDRYDSTRRGSIAYVNRNGVCLSDAESMVVQQAPVLHQEFHALCFASGAVRQIDFTQSLSASSSQHRQDYHSLQFLTPILDLLRMGLTRCNRIVLRGCPLGYADIRELAEALAPVVLTRGLCEEVLSCPAVSLEVLDIANSNLSDAALKLLFQLLPNTGHTLQRLDVSGNGRVEAAAVACFAESLANMKILNLCGSVMGCPVGPLISTEILSRLDHLEELDLSNFKLNDASQRALERYLLRLSAVSQASEEGAGPGCALRRLVLNNCGITGYAGARIFGAMTGLNVHLHLGSNPLETGIDHFADAIGLCWKGTFGLHLDMVEFRDEANFVRLVKALTFSNYIRFLSLVGTAPTPTEEALCSPQMCAALENFFAANRSLRFLDLSGFSGRLDEGQLGKGFGRSLCGLAHNKTLTHLRLRNQNLHDDVGSLRFAIGRNSTLRSLDCQDNNLNLTSFRYLAQSLAQNGSIVDFPVEHTEQERILARCLLDVPTLRRKKGAAPVGVPQEQVVMLRNDIENSVSELQSYVKRNRTAAENRTGYILNFEDAAEAGGNPGWPSLDLRLADGSTPTDAAQAANQERCTVRSSSVPPVVPPLYPYRVPQNDDNAINGTSRSTSPASADLTTPEREERGGVVLLPRESGGITHEMGGGPEFRDGEIGSCDRPSGRVSWRGVAARRSPCA